MLNIVRDSSATTCIFVNTTLIHEYFQNHKMEQEGMPKKKKKDAQHYWKTDTWLCKKLLLVAVREKGVDKLICLPSESFCPSVPLPPPSLTSEAASTPSANDLPGIWTESPFVLQVQEMEKSLAGPEWYQSGKLMFRITGHVDVA